MVRSSTTRASHRARAEAHGRTWAAATLLGALPDDMGAMPAPEGDGASRERLPRYQEFQRNAGSVMEMDPGWEVQNIQSPAPTVRRKRARWRC